MPNRLVTNGNEKSEGFRVERFSNGFVSGRVSKGWKNVLYVVLKICKILLDN